MFVSLLASALLAPSTLAVPLSAKPFSWEGVFVEGCSCMSPCPCEISDVRMGCQGVGVYVFNKGKYGTTDLAGLKLAYGIQPGEWVTLFIEAKNANQRKAAVEFATTAFKEAGKVLFVRDAKISVTGSKGKYTVTVEKAFTLKTEPILGGDGKSPISISNVKNPIHPTVFLGKTVQCTYNDGERSFDIQDTNSYFNNRAMSTAQL